VGIGPISVASYLARSEIVVRLASNEVAPALAHRWAEPLEAGLLRVLEQNLEARGVAREFVAYPWRPDRGPACQVELRVTRFDVEGENAVVVANWEVKALQPAGRIVRGEKRIEAPLASAGSLSGAAAAFSEALGTLSNALAANVAEVRAPAAAASPGSTP
jgi:uncharacterized lipoprotein YmbA